MDEQEIREASKEIIRNNIKERRKIGMERMVNGWKRN